MLTIGTESNPFSTDYIDDSLLYIKSLFSKKENEHLKLLLNYLSQTDWKSWQQARIEDIDALGIAKQSTIESNKSAVYKNFINYFLQFEGDLQIEAERLVKLNSLLNINTQSTFQEHTLILEKLVLYCFSDRVIDENEIKLITDFYKALGISYQQFADTFINATYPKIKKIFESEPKDVASNDDATVKSYYQLLTTQSIKYSVDEVLIFLTKLNSYRFQNGKEILGIALDFGFEYFKRFPVYLHYNCTYGKLKTRDGQKTYETKKAELFFLGAGFVIAYKYAYLDRFDGTFDLVTLDKIKSYNKGNFLNTNEPYIIIQKKGERNPYCISGLASATLDFLYTLFPQMNQIIQGVHKTDTPATTSSNQSDLGTKVKQPKTPTPVSSSSKENNTSPLEELQELIGIPEVKEQVKSIINFVKVQEIRRQKNLKTTELTLHSVFTGAPGTGKTTVARIYGGVLKELGVLQKGHVIEVDRSGLVAGYVGQTAIKVDEVINKALDGILFIDEAYSLAQSANDPFGEEAISVFLKRMEDYRDRLVVIVAGYDKEMDAFLNSNSGLRSRFTRFFHFNNYSSTECLEIIQLLAKKNEYTFTGDLLQNLQLKFDQEIAANSNFSNGRYVRNVFEKLIENHSNRIAVDQDLTDEEIVTITTEDL